MGHLSITIVLCLSLENNPKNAFNLRQNRTSYLVGYEDYQVHELQPPNIVEASFLDSQQSAFSSLTKYVGQKALFKNISLNNIEARQRSFFVSDVLPKLQGLEPNKIVSKKKGLF